MSADATLRGSAARATPGAKAKETQDG